MTPTGNLDNVELTHNSITLGVMKRQFKTKFWHNFGHTMYVAYCLSHRMEVLYINKDQRSTGTVIQNVLWMNTAATGRCLQTQRPTGTDKYCVTQHPMTSYEA